MEKEKKLILLILGAQVCFCPVSLEKDIVIEGATILLFHTICN